VVLLGVGIALRYFLQGQTVSLVISNPAVNSTLSRANTNFARLRVMPFLPHQAIELPGGNGHGYYLIRVGYRAHT